MMMQCWDWNLTNGSDSVSLILRWLRGKWSHYCVLTYHTRVYEHWVHYTQTTAPGPLQWLIMGVMNDDALLRLEPSRWKHLHQLTFEVLTGWDSSCSTHFSDPNVWALGLYHPNHCSWTIPMSHCGYEEWWCTVEIGIHHLEVSPPSDFWGVGRKSVGLLCSTYFSDQSLWSLGQ